MANVGCCLSRFMAHHERLGIDEAECINDYLALDRLNRVHDNGDCAGRELLE